MINRDGQTDFGFDHVHLGESCQKPLEILTLGMKTSVPLMFLSRAHTSKP